MLHFSSDRIDRSRSHCTRVGDMFNLLIKNSKKAKFSRICYERWARSQSRCTGNRPEEVSPQVTFKSSPVVYRLLLLSARPPVSFPVEKCHRPSTSTKLYCLVTQTQVCEQLAYGCYAALSR